MQVTLAIWKLVFTLIYLLLIFSIGYKTKILNYNFIKIDSCDFIKVWYNLAPKDSRKTWDVTSNLPNLKFDYLFPQNVGEI